MKGLLWGYRDTGDPNRSCPLSGIGYHGGLLRQNARKDGTALEACVVRTDLPAPWRVNRLNLVTSLNFLLAAFGV